jgi:hypothetical protein
MSKPSKLGVAIAAKARQQRMIDAEALLKAKKRQKARDALSLANSVTPEGFTPAMRAKLQDASRRANEDPRAKAIVEQAALQFRIEQLRREKGIGNVSPPMFMGEPADGQGRPIINGQKPVPPSVGEQMAKKKEAKK